MAEAEPLGAVFVGTRGGRVFAVLDRDGTPIDGSPLTDPGFQNPMGLTTDTHGNVWVANFADQRLSAFCGTDSDTCPRGLETGEAISPDDTGYAFDGFTRNTGVAVDPSGNVWVANNWENIPVQTNPGAHQIVAFVGAAAPLPVEPFTSTLNSSSPPFRVKVQS